MKQNSTENIKLRRVDVLGSQCIAKLSEQQNSAEIGVIHISAVSVRVTGLDAENVKRIFLIEGLPCGCPQHLRHVRCQHGVDVALLVNGRMLAYYGFIIIFVGFLNIHISVYGQLSADHLGKMLLFIAAESEIFLYALIADIRDILYRVSEIRLYLLKRQLKGIAYIMEQRGKAPLTQETVSGSVLIALPDIRHIVMSERFRTCVNCSSENKDIC